MRLFFSLLFLALPVHASTWGEVNQSLLEENWALADIQLSELSKGTISQRERFNVLLNQAWVNLKLGLQDEAKSNVKRIKSLSYVPTELEKLTLNDTALMIKYQPIASLPEIDVRMTVDADESAGSDPEEKSYPYEQRYLFKTAQSASQWATKKIDQFLDSDVKQSVFIKPIAPKLDRGEFEKSEQFIARVEEAQNQYKKMMETFYQNERAKKLAVESQRRQREQYLPTVSRLYTQVALKKTIGKPEFILEPYVPDREYFLAKIQPEHSSDLFQGLTVAIDEPIATAPRLKGMLLQAKPALIFKYDTNGVKLASVLLELPDRSIREVTVIEQPEEQQQFASYQVPEIHYQPDDETTSSASRIFMGSSEVILNSIDPEIKRLKTALGSAQLSNNRQTIARLEQDIAQFESRVQQSFDDDLEAMLKKVAPVPENPNHYAIVVGINKYSKTLNVQFADRSARLFSKVVQRVLGVPKDNIIELYDEEATGSTIKTRLNFSGKNLKASDKLFFFYAGHGIPAQREEGDPYLLAHDMSAGFASMDEDMKLSNIWNLLTSSGEGKVVAFIDSCFSGNSDNRLIYEGVAPGLLKRKAFAQQGNDNLLIYTAGNEQQFANYYPEKGHRLFSYFLLKGLMEGIKQPEQLHRYLARNVQRISQKNGPDYMQTPQMNGTARETF